MVRHFDASSEDSHDPVTYIGDERAAVGEDRVSHRLEVPVEEVDHLLGRELLRGGREPTKVTEHDGRDQFFAAEPQVGVRLCEHLVDHRFGYEAGEDVPDSLALERVRDIFSRFVPEPVVDQVLAQTNADLRLGGKELVATVMFCDLRGFTTAAEQLPAEKVIDLLNRYLEAMTDTILAHGGTLVSYIGDGIMAVFGARIEMPDHADRALAAAREMVTERLPRFNAWLVEEGLAEGFKMGIGLHTGPIMSGNVGSAKRLEYTAIGDAVNGVLGLHRRLDIRAGRRPGRC